MAPKFTQDIVSATASARKLSGVLDGTGDLTKSYAGPGQHVLVRSVIAEMVDGDVTAKSVLALVAPLSTPRLKALATDKSVKCSGPAVKGLRAISAKCLTSKGKVDAWASGRFLAAIVHTYVLELRRNERKGSTTKVAAAA
jgi:hypothetical protein